MRKTLSFLLCTVMIVSMFFINVSAVGGTAINSAADFAAMAADGYYYLNADIKIDATYETAFTGTLNGNGHTVTVSVPMFAQFDGQVRDLTIDGAGISGNEDLAAFAIFTSDMTAVNVVNKVDITVTGISDDKTSGLNAGGIVANADLASTCIFSNCINYGNITIQTAEVKDATTGAEYETHAGGICGRVDAVEIKYSENHGIITALSINGQAGGMFGRAAYSALYTPCDITDCTNTAEINGGLDAGGIAGYIGASNNNINIPYTITYCVNTGNISGGYRAGGFVGYCYASGANTTYYIEITYSVTIANVKAGRAATTLDGKAQYAFVSLFIGYSNSVNNKIIGCLAVGDISAIEGTNFVAPFRCIMGCSSAKTADMQLKDNYICDNDTTEWYSYATDSTKNADQQIPIATALDAGKVTRCTLTDLQSGTILDKLNSAAGTTVFSQNIGTDLYPMIDTSLRANRASADAIVFEEPSTTTTVPETTTAAPKETTAAVVDETTDASVEETTAASVEETTAATTTAATTEKGGCGSVFVGGIAIVAILGSAVVLGKKH